jgi:hypothetical protein
MNSTAPNSEPNSANPIGDGSVRVAWVDQQGRLRCMVGRCIDASARRIHVEAPQQLPLRTRVTLSAGRRVITGPSVVKYVTKYETRFILVLE